MHQQRVQTARHYLRVLAGPVFVLVMFLAALWFLHLELRNYHLQDFFRGLASIRPAFLALAVALTILNYAILIGYDWLGIWYIRHPMKLRRVALASFLGYAVGNNFGLLFGGSTIRYRLYSAWGLAAVDIVKLVFILAITFWIGLFALSGVVFLLEPLPVPDNLRLPINTTRPLGALLLSLAVAYLLICAFRRRPIRIGNWEFSPPPFALSVMQYLVAALDLIVAASVLYMLLYDAVGISFFSFVAIFLLAQVVVFLTQVPGGLGVLELTVLTLLNPAQPDKVVGALLAYRMIYYLTPMAIGILLLGAHEVSLHRRQLRPAFDALGRWSPDVAPKLLAWAAIVSGMFLLFSAAIPTSGARIQWMADRLPLWLVELSSFLRGISGVVLLLVARPLNHRIRLAYWITAAALLAGIVFSLLSGLTYEVAIVLALLLLAHLPCRHYFFRSVALFPTRISFRWLMAIATVIIVSAWLMMFAYKEIPYAQRLWTDVAWDGHLSRSLRAIAAAVLAVLLFYMGRLVSIRFRHPEAVRWEDLQAARGIVRRDAGTLGHLALLADKRLLLNEEGTAMVMYGVRRKSWVSLGDPIGPHDQALQLAWDFFEICDGAGNHPVFFLAQEHWSLIYQEMKLKIFHVADTARIHLQLFEVGHLRPELQQLSERVDQAGCTFDVIRGAEVENLFPALRSIQLQWLGQTGQPSKRFLASWFSEEYIREHSIGVVHQGDRVIAFTVLRTSAGHEELAADMIRFAPAAPQGIVEWILLQSICWGGRQRYRWFNLGEAPIAKTSGDPFSAQFAGLLVQAADHVYTDVGLRNFVQRFQPVWSPKFIAVPSRFVLPAVIEDLSQLIRGT